MVWNNWKDYDGFARLKRFWLGLGGLGLLQWMAERSG